MFSTKLVTELSGQAAVLVFAELQVVTLPRPFRDRWWWCLHLLPFPAWSMIESGWFQSPGKRLECTPVM